MQPIKIKEEINGGFAWTTMTINQFKKMKRKKKDMGKVEKNSKNEYK